MMGRIVPEQDNQYLREMIFGNYRIIYELTKDQTKIEILTIHHHSRLLSNNPALDNED